MLLPPVSLITRSMDFVVMNSAERDGEFITNLKRKTLRLRVANVMRLRRGAAANQAGLTGHKTQMLL
jgi:hypothetical protein